MNIRWRIAKESDAETVAVLAESTFVEMWHSFYSAEDMQKYTTGAFAVPSIAALLQQPELHRFILAEVDGVLAGYAKLTFGTSMPEFDGSFVVEIERFYFFKKYHGTGVAHALMEYILLDAEKRCAGWVFLGVDVNNHRAIRFYSRYGFTVFGRKEFRVGAVVDIDQLMKRPIPAG